MRWGGGEEVVEIVDVAAQLSRFESRVSHLSAYSAPGARNTVLNKIIYVVVFLGGINISSVALVKFLNCFFTSENSGGTSRVSRSGSQEGVISIRPALHSFPAGDWPALLGYPLRAGPEGSWGEAKPAGLWAGTHGECGGAAHQPSPSAKGRGQGGVSRRALEAGDPGGVGEASPPATVTLLWLPLPPPRAVQYRAEVGERVLECGGGAEPGASRERRHRPQESAWSAEPPAAEEASSRRAGRGGGRAPCSPGRASAGCLRCCEAAGSAKRLPLAQVHQAHSPLCPALGPWWNTGPVPALPPPGSGGGPRRRRGRVTGLRRPRSGGDPLSETPPPAAMCCFLGYPASRQTCPMPVRL
ncbi:uncharacterized protein [Muntiacus reevesi]|uniref:uncharacterized protein n=1 Tax=Muntiacus reevesi TaxID=9886 RepID=UPI00330795D2